MNRSFVTTAFLSISLFACGGSEAEPPTQTPPDTSGDGCVRDTLEPDFGSDPLQGPGVDAEGNLAPGTYIVSSTYIHQKGTPESEAKFQELEGPIVGALQNQPGLVAFRLGISASCSTGRTLTVWKDEEAMYQFVGSPAHVEAMARIGEVSRGDSVATSWHDDERGATWEKALARLAAETGPTY
jgi:heme-degrading monooxygenase HmoA